MLLAVAALVSALAATTSLLAAMRPSPAATEWALVAALGGLLAGALAIAARRTPQPARAVAFAAGLVGGAVLAAVLLQLGLGLGRAVVLGTPPLLSSSQSSRALAPTWSATA